MFFLFAVYIIEHYTYSFSSMTVQYLCKIFFFIIIIVFEIIEMYVRFESKVKKTTLK